MLHGAYSFVPAFDADVVGSILGRLGLPEGSVILDPFCGTGTTLLESKLHGFPSVGVDANPVCVLVSKAKTEWELSVPEAEVALRHIVASASREYRRYAQLRRKAEAAGSTYPPQSAPGFLRSAAGRYLISSGLIRRGWISPRPALKTLLLAERLWELPPRPRNFLLLSLLGLLVPEISNMSYGPEIYRARRRSDCDVFGLFLARAQENFRKLESLRATRPSPVTRVRLGDSVNGGLGFIDPESVDCVITSPPYLSDHDYSRLTRLELVFSGHLASREDLRAIKERLLRSSSKNVYKHDRDAELVEGFASVRSVIETISDRAARERSGFARVYPRLVGEYFGGMYKHFKALGRVLRPRGKAAYIVADQSSFFAFPIPTARIVAELAEGSSGALRLMGMEPLKKYRGTRGKVSWSNQEWLIVLEKEERSS